MILSSPRARAIGMRWSDSQGTSSPWLPITRRGGWESLMVHDSKLRVLRKRKGGRMI